MCRQRQSEAMRRKYVRPLGTASCFLIFDLPPLYFPTFEGAAFYSRQALAAHRFISPTGASTAASLQQEPSPAVSLEHWLWPNLRLRSPCHSFHLPSSREPASITRSHEDTRTVIDRTILCDSVASAAFSVIFSALSFPFSFRFQLPNFLTGLRCRKHVPRPPFPECFLFFLFFHS